MATIEARGLRKVFGTTIALDGVDLRVEEGRILGLIGPNGAGKTTALECDSRPHLVSGRTEGPRTRSLERARRSHARCLFHCRCRCAAALDAGFAVARLRRRRPSAIRSREGGRFSWRRRQSNARSKVRELSKGMVAQLHLALVMAIDAKLLVLDEPTLGLDILYRKQFYDSLLNDYFDRSRTIVVTTHQVEEIQDVLTDLMFIDRGRIVLECSMEEFDSRYLEVMVNPEHLAAARALKPMHERPVFGRSVLLFDHGDRQQLAALGEVRRPSIADLFVAVMGNAAAHQGHPKASRRRSDGKK